MTENETQSRKPGPKPKATETDEEKVALQTKLAELEAKFAALKESTGDLPVPLTEIADDEILIHVVSDKGLTFAQLTWHKSQELKFKKGTPQYNETLDANGNSWLDMADDPYKQEERFGEVKFRSGPWKGKEYVNLDSKGVSPEALEAALRKERQRNREVPLPPVPRIL